MERIAAQAKYAEMHEALPFHDGTFAKWGKERSSSFPYRYDEGVTIWVAESDLTPHDHFLGGKLDCAECSVSNP